MTLTYDPLLFEAWVYKHLRHQLKKPCAPFHREFCAALRHNRVAIAAPRGFSKSTWVSIFYPLYMILENPGITVVILGAVADRSLEMVNSIRMELETNTSLRLWYGDQEKGSTKWTTEELRLANGSRVIAKSTGKQVRGIRPRPSIVIGDDLETDELVVNPERRKKFDNWFWTDVYGVFEGGAGQLVVIGTILHPESFLAEITSPKSKNWAVRFYSAITKTGESLWPAMFPIERLRQMQAEMPPGAFEQEYMNDPLPDDRRIFQEKWFQFFDQEPPGCTYFTTVDPAISLDRKSDFTAIVTCAVDEDENIYVVDIVNKHLLPSETVDLIFKHYKLYNSAVIGIESVGFQKMLLYELNKQKIQRKLYPVTRELKSEGRRKHLRIEALQPFFERGKVFIKESQQELMTQLLRFPSPRCHDDIIDALAYQLDIVRASPKKAQLINPESFIAELERRRERNMMGDGVWGNHKLCQAPSHWL